MTIESNPSIPFGLNVTSSATAVAAPPTLMFPTTGLEDWLKANARAYLMTLELPSDVLEWIGKIGSYGAFAEWTQVGTPDSAVGNQPQRSSRYVRSIHSERHLKNQTAQEMKNILLPPILRIC
jgi:hypothetical protein